MPLLGLASCLDQSGYNVKRKLDFIMDRYDYIVIGGGTSGLVVATRLSEDPNKTVLVVEHGDFANTINVTVPYFTTGDQTPRLYHMPSTPQVNLAGRVSNLRIGNVVGGSGTVNGMAWVRGSAIDYDSWENLGNPGWGWDTLIKYFRKSSRFSPPAAKYVEQYGYEWSRDAYGDGPIHVGYPSWQWPAAALQARAWVDDLNASVLIDGADGDNVGIAWLPQNSDGVESTRSTSETAYYSPASGRPNLHLLVRHYGANVEFQGNVTIGVQVVSRDRGDSRFVSSENVVLAAGAVNTPRLLQLSGIGPASLLEKFGVDVVVDNPGVGANFQDHPSFYMIYQFDNDTVINPDSMNSTEFYEEAWEEYVWNKTGPFSHAWGNRIVFLSLRDLYREYKSIVDGLCAQDPLAYLPAIYAENPALLKGFLRQCRVMQSQFLSSRAGVVEIAFGGSTKIPVALQKPLSRGTIFINSTDPDPSIPPLIDFNAMSNPIDMRIILNAFRKVRQFMATESVASLKPVELSPGPIISSDVEVETVMRESQLNPSFDHPAGTAAMMPRELGGVVDSRLRVYGVKGLWVVDASVMPILPAAHTQATVYAVAEYAADLIRNSGASI
ncbi:GMC oxidoreductase [Hypomontagnella monticulosa]|nr:GMC oxidoreductase [Hypomontagnella monticulosa]